MIGALIASLPPANARAMRPETRHAPWVAYQSSVRDGVFGDDGIFLMHPDGSLDHEIATSLPGQHIHPDWSADGQLLAFRADVGDYAQLFLTDPVHDPTGAHARQLTNCADDCDQVDDVALSPDGTRVAYVEDTGIVTVDQIDVPSVFALRVARITAAGLTDVHTVVESRTDPQSHVVDELVEPRWSPDGHSLVYWSDRTDGRTVEVTGTAIYTVHADGTHPRQITPRSMFAGEVDWSPDGRRLVFVSHPLIVFNFDDVVSNLYTSKTDGTHRRQLTHSTTSADRATQARWTPDGRIIYTRVTANGRALWVRHANGHDPNPIGPATPARPIRTHGDVQPTTEPPRTP